MRGTKIWSFHTTLRDGVTTRGVDFPCASKLCIAHALGEIGIDYIEGCWSGTKLADNASVAAFDAGMIWNLLYEKVAGSKAAA